MSTGVATTTSREAVPEQVVPLRHWGRYVAAVIVLALLGCLIAGLAVNRNVDIHTVGQYLFNHQILSGVVVTIELAVVSQAVGIVLGVIFAVMRQSTNPVLSGVSWLYLWVFRAVPLIVQILFWGDFGAFYFHLNLGIPFTHVVAVGTESNTLLTTFVAAAVALSLNEGAYMAEVVRAGLLAVDEGQTEAALSLGMTRGLLLRRIVLPQAIRVIIPPTGNEFISMLKNTSLIVIIAGPELLYRTQSIYSANFKEIPLLIVASIWYLVMTSVLMVGQYYLERHYARGSLRVLPLTPLQRVRLLVGGRRRTVVL